MRRFVHRVAAVFRPRHADERLDEEVRAHLDLLAAEYERQGLSPDQARHAARRDFGGIEQLADDENPLTMLAACGVLALTVLVASCVPALRASRVDPVLALKAE